MTPEETIQRVRDAMAAFNRGDIAALGEFVHPDYTYTIRGRASVSGVYQGWEAWSRGIAPIKELTGGSMSATPEVVLADDESAMMYARVTGSRPDGRTYDSHQAYLYRLKDGKFVEGQTIPVDQQAFAEFLA